MVKILCGLKGTGKTKKMIEMANYDASSIKGDTVFIEAGNKHVLDLNHRVRYINAMEFDINNIERFHGFLCGIIAEDFDIEKIYIDGIYKIANIDETLLKDSVEKLEKLGQKFELDFIISLDYRRNEVPNEVQRYVLD